MAARSTSGVDWERCRYSGSQSCATIDRLKGEILDAQKSLSARHAAAVELMKVNHANEPAHALMHGACKTLHQFMLEHAEELLLQHLDLRPFVNFGDRSELAFRGTLEVGCPCMKAAARTALSAGARSEKRATFLTLLVYFVDLILTARDAAGQRGSDIRDAFLGDSLRALYEEQTLRDMMSVLGRVAEEGFPHVGPLAAVQACNMLGRLRPDIPQQALMLFRDAGAADALVTVALALIDMRTTNPRGYARVDDAIPAMGTAMMALGDALNNTYRALNETGFAASMIQRVNGLPVLRLAARLVEERVDLPVCKEYFWFLSVFVGSRREDAEDIVDQVRLAELIMELPPRHAEAEIAECLLVLLHPLLARSPIPLTRHTRRLAPYLIAWLNGKFGGQRTLDPRIAHNLTRVIQFHIESLAPNDTGSFDVMLQAKLMPYLTQRVRSGDDTKGALQLMRYMSATYPRSLLEIARSFDSTANFITTVMNTSSPDAERRESDLVLYDVVGMLANSKDTWIPSGSAKDKSLQRIMSILPHAYLERAPHPLKLDVRTAVGQLMVIRVFLGHDDCRARFQMNDGLRKSLISHVKHCIVSSERQAAGTPIEVHVLHEALVGVMDIAYMSAADHDETWAEQARMLVRLGKLTPDSDSEVLGATAVAIWNYARHADLARIMAAEGGLPILHRAAAHPSDEFDDFVEVATANLRAAARAR